MEQQYQETHQEPPQEHPQDDLQGGFNSSETVVVGNNSATLYANPHHHSVSPVVAAVSTSPASNGKAPLPRPPHAQYGNCLSKNSPPLPPRTSPIRRTLSGDYKVLPLPTTGNNPAGPGTSPIRSFPTLRRCRNEPAANPPSPPRNLNLNPVDRPPNGSVSNFRAESVIPSSSPVLNSPIPTASYVPRHPLIRSISDPNPVLWTPPHATAKIDSDSAAYPRNYSMSPTPGSSSGVDSMSSTPADDSPASKRLKIVGDGMREMRRWFDELIREHEKSCEAEFNTGMVVSDLSAGYGTEVKENGGDPNNAVVAAREHGFEGISGGEGEEAEDEEEKGEEEDLVLAEKVGDRTHLKFKCRCGSGYDVLLIGQNCFYKLL